MPGGGAHPRDAELFSAQALPLLRVAARELGLLRASGYALPSALKVVGDRYQLRERQRVALTRATSEALHADARRSRRVNRGLRPEAIWVDGFNVLITVETGLRGGVVLRGLDSSLRDLSGVHGTYRLSPTTEAALDEVIRALRDRGWAQTPLRWFFDQPVSNSGRLAARVRERASKASLPWTVDVVADADRELWATPPRCAVASSDAVVLDRCPAWIDLPADALQGHAVWLVDLGP